MARAAIVRVCELIRSLYASHQPDHVRGAIVEGLVKRRLRNRYAAGLLGDNVFVETTNGATYRTSTTVDVAGWHRVDDRGECHDCKVRARWFDVSFLRELELNLPQPHFRIGIVTTDTYANARRELAKQSYRPRAATIISLEKLWDFAPLQV